MKNCILLILLLISSISKSQEVQLIKIDSIVNSKVSENEPGLMIGIVKDGEIIYENYKGLANVEHQVKIGSKTRSNIASTAKQFTALMVLKLALEKKLNLEDDFRKYLPNFYPEVKEEIKIRHLINHTSGIRDYVELMGLQNRIWWKQVGLNNNDIIELLEKQENLGFSPGKHYSYSNSNYNILAKLIEKVTGKKFTDYSDDFFMQLGMNSTSFIKRYMQVIPNRAAPYSDWGYGELFHSISVTKTAGEGFLYTTLEDQLLFEKALQNAKQSKDTLLMKSQLPIPNSEIKSYGFGLKLNDRLGRKAVHHDGVTNAYHAQCLRFPKEKIAIFIMSNNGNLRSDLLADEIAILLLKKQNRTPTYNTRYYKDNHRKANIIGQYNYPNNEKLVRIEKENGKTYWKEGDYFNLEMIAEGINKFRFKNNPTLKIVFYDNRMVEYYDSGKTMKYKRSRALPISSSNIKDFIGSYYNKELDLTFNLKRSEEGKLNFMFSNDKKWKDVALYNNADFFVNGNLFFKANRDNLNKITDILLNYARAKNIKFKKNL